MFINWKSRELNLKIVYYGPALSGKTTNLQVVHARTNPKVRGDLVSLKTQGDRTLFFDFMQLELGEILGFRPKFQLYTVPGQTVYEATRKLVLRGADGIVFVADSQASRLADNIESFQDMHRHLTELGLDLQRTPRVVQFNKRDLPALVPVSVLKQLFAPNGGPSFESVATEGSGVFDTLKAAISLVMSQAQRRLSEAKTESK